MGAADCASCRKALKAALLQKQDPSKLKIINGHIEGCRDAADHWPWAEPKAEPRPAPVRAVARVPQRRAAPPPPAEPEPRRKPAAKHEIHRFKRVDHATKGEKFDQRRGVWLVVTVIATMLITPIFPPFALVSLGIIVALFLVR